jgi:indolepyruvate ferredoxin oxidoreductase alpha subunit
MAERSFAKEVQLLRLGAGAEIRTEGIVAVAKALLQSGVAYIGGYPGAPIAHLMDVLADARDILDGLEVRFEASASEATAAAMLGASINHSLRGAVVLRSTGGTSIASDALAHLASAGVKGGVLILLGEDYGDGASSLQERTHTRAMKSQIWLLDPRPSLPALVRAVEQGFDLSEASRTPVMLMLRVRACHIHGRFIASDNRPPAFSVADALRAPTRDPGRIVLPPSTHAQEREKIEQRLPAAQRFVAEQGMNEILSGDLGDLGIVLQGGLYNTVLRALALLGLADVLGNCQIPLYVLGVTYPLVPEEWVRFCRGKRAVLVVEEGQPEHIEQAAHQILRRHDVEARLLGKDVLPSHGEYTVEALRRGIAELVRRAAPGRLRPRTVAEAPLLPAGRLAELVPARPPGLCTGCPERPLFTALSLLQREVGALHISADVGCHSMATLPPFNLGASIMGRGLGAAGAAALQARAAPRAVALMGDGGFWHGGLTSGIGNAVFNRHDSLTVIIDNNSSAATGGQDILSSRGANSRLDGSHSIRAAVRGVGVRWVRRTRTYNMRNTLKVLRQGLTGRVRGPKVIVAEGECQLSRQRRLQPLQARAIREGGRVVEERFGVDPDTCTGDHSCIRLSGCPSLTIRENPDPLRTDPVAHVDDSCVGCGVCGEVAHAAVLCPSFHRVEIVRNPRLADRLLARVREVVIGALQRARERRLRERAL